jgi:hypothetical protein
MPRPYTPDKLVNLVGGMSIQRHPEGRTHRPPPRFLAAALVLLIMPGQPLEAQRPEDDALLELVAVLMDTPPQNFLLGRLTEAAPFGQEVLAGARIVGSVDRETGGSVVLAVLGRPEAAILSIRERLQESGFREARSPSVRRGGFVTNVGPADLPVLCGESTTVRVSAGMTGPAGAAHVTVNWNLSNDFSPCRAGPLLATPMPSPFPELEPPPGVLVRGSSPNAPTVFLHNDPGVGPDRWQTEASLLTGRPIAAMKEHYSAEMTRHGMALGEEQVADFAAVRPFTWTDKGTDWEGDLGLVRGREGHNPVIHATIRMWRVPR